MSSHDKRQNELTTGQVSGLLGIPLSTLQRYMRDYGDYFSEGARVKTRGRRYTPADVEKIVIIRRMSQERAGLENIRGYLAEPAPEGELQEFPDAYTLLLAANAANNETIDNAKRIDGLIEGIRRERDLFGTVVRSFYKMLRQVQDHELEIHRLRILVGVDRTNFKVWGKQRPLMKKFSEWMQAETRRKHDEFTETLERIDREREEFLDEFGEDEESFNHGLLHNPR